MMVRSSAVLTYQPETIAAAQKLAAGCVDAQSHALGMTRCEPITVMMDALLRYAKAYRVRFESPLADDGALADIWLDAALSVKALCDGDGAFAWEVGRTTDSKSNGAIESMFEAALAAGGFDRKALGI